MLYRQGFGSRRECRALVLAGRIELDGRLMEDPSWAPGTGATGDPALERLSLVVDGVGWPIRRHAVLMLHKPAGYECSLKPRHHPGVMGLIAAPLRNRGVQPVGRLDQDTTGLLLLTDDGVLNHRLTSPKWHVPKRYRIECRHRLEPDTASRLLEGVTLDDDPSPVRALAVEPQIDGRPRTLLMVIGEGRYHQVKRMIAAIGNRVESLHRTAIGGLELDPSLGPGQWRWLSPAEDSALRCSVGLDPDARR